MYLSSLSIAMRKLSIESVCGVNQTRFGFYCTGLVTKVLILKKHLPLTLNLQLVILLCFGLLYKIRTMVPSYTFEASKV